MSFTKAPHLRLALASASLVAPAVLIAHAFAVVLVVATPAMARAEARNDAQNAAPAVDRSDWHRLIGILQYLEADFPFAVETQSEFELNEQKEFIANAIELARELGPEAAPFAERLEALRAPISAGENPEAVSKECGDIIEGLVTVGGLQRSPRRPPDMERARQIFAESCASCHGPKGDADVPIAATLEPPPTNFHDSEVMEGLSPYRSFNTISFGVEGTTMTSFRDLLDEDDRWSLAFFVFSLRHKPCDGPPADVDLDVLGTSTDGQLAERFGADAVACLRTRPPELELEGSLEIARQKVREVKAFWAAGDDRKARQAALDAYLEGLEPVEPLIGARDRRLVLDLEKAFLDLRLATERRGPDVNEAADAVLVLIERAASSTNASPLAAFWFSLLIILREGFEAMVVITALVAVLRRTGEMQHLRMVHLGWVSALLLGALAFVAGQKLLAGANREWMEGLIALTAVGMLIYAATWMNSKSNTRKMMAEIRGQMTDAAGKGSALGVFAITFTAVLRESFETALFLQGLATDSAVGTAWGALVGAVALIGLIFGMLKLGLRLPMQQLFRVSTLVLCATAVVLLGKGLSALQEVGVLPLMPVPFVRIDMLGIQPDLVTLVPQFLLIGALTVWQRRTAAPPSAPSSAAVSGG